MCLALMAHQAHPRYPLVIAANRDEFYDRPTAPAAFWPDAPEVLAGRDLLQGGTWLGISRSGRWALVTNFRERPQPQGGERSRGLLVADFLRSDTTPAGWFEALSGQLDAFPGFNLLFGQGEQAFYVSNRGESTRLDSGLFALSNHLLLTPWPKVRKSRAAFAAALRTEAPDPEALFAILSDTSAVADRDLPDTGFGLEWERVLAPVFVQSPTYGTRTSTVVLVSATGEVQLIERTFCGPPGRWQEVRHDFLLDSRVG